MLKWLATLRDGSLRFRFEEAIDALADTPRPPGCAKLTGTTNRQIVFTLRFLTHAEYSKDRWKDEL